MSGPLNPFANLPPISFANFDVNGFQTAFIKAWQAAWLSATGETLILGPADRRYHFLLSLTGFLLAGYQQIDYSAKENLLPLAQGGFLDSVCAIFGLLRSPRIPAAGATCTLQFTLPQLYAFSQTIPAGTQVGDTSGSGLVFSTNQALTISANVLSGQVTATCLTLASSGNNIPIGAISALLNWGALTPQTFLPAVSNINATSGGVDPESDSAFAQRMFIVTDSYSNAGSYGAYQFFAQQVAGVSQVSVSGPEDGLAPGNVLITVIGANGAMPNSSMLAAVAAAVTPNTIRDLCANVTIQAPTGVPVSVSVSYYIPASQVNNIVNIQTAVSGAVQTWINLVTQNLDTDFDPSLLSSMMSDAGAINITITNPSSFVNTNKYQIGTLVGIPIINYLGLQT